MHLGRQQRGVAIGMVAGLMISFAVILLGSQLFVNLEAPDRLGISLLLPALGLFVAIARVAKHRFVTPADIDGSALTVGTDRAKLLQALLQNTLEQLAFAVPVYLAALLNTADSVSAAVPACACTFLLGRIVFFVTYRRGAAARALGFALTFYPTVLLLGWQLCLISGRVAG